MSYSSESREVELRSSTLSQEHYLKLKLEIDFKLNLKLYFMFSSLSASNFCNRKRMIPLNSN